MTRPPVARRSMTPDEITTTTAARHAGGPASAVPSVTVAASALFPSSSPSLEADAIALDQFVGLLFRYADERTFVSWRAFPDDADKGAPVFIESSIVTDDTRTLARPRPTGRRKAAQFPRPAVFCPPIATFTSAKRARELDLANGLALSVECDAHPQQRARAPRAAPGSGDCRRRLWRGLARSRDPGSAREAASALAARRADVGRRVARALKRARILATRLVGGDATNIPAVHPIRWPGSWHRKGVPRLARIVTSAGDRELELTTRSSSSRTRRGSRQSSAHTLSLAGVAGDGGAPSSALIQQLMSGEAMHAPLCALAMRYVLGGMHAGRARRRRCAGSWTRSLRRARR
jgi:hypothetical protein